MTARKPPKVSHSLQRSEELHAQIKRVKKPAQFSLQTSKKFPGGRLVRILTIRQLLLVRNPPLQIKRIMLGQVESDVRVESANDVFFNVELIDEAVEDAALHGFGRRVAGAVAGVGAAFGEDAGVEAWCSGGSEGEEGG